MERVECPKMVSLLREDLSIGATDLLEAKEQRVVPENLQEMGQWETGHNFAKNWRIFWSFLWLWLCWSNRFESSTRTKDGGRTSDGQRKRGKRRADHPSVTRRTAQGSGHTCARLVKANIKVMTRAGHGIYV